MKPGVIQGDKPAAIIVQPAVIDETGRKRGTFRAVLISSCFTLLCVCGLSFGLYFGLRAKETVVNNVYFQEDQGDQIPANVTVTKHEECYNFENAAVVYDFSTGLTVYKSNADGEKDAGCLVESFMMNETKTPDDVRDLIEKDKLVGQTNFEEFRVTKVWLNEEALGPMSRDMCADQEINFIEKVGNGDSTDYDTYDVPDLGELVPEESHVRKRRGWLRIRVRVRIRVRLSFRFRIGRRK